jgi:hypothetical protein
VGSTFFNGTQHGEGGGGGSEMDWGKISIGNILEYEINKKAFQKLKIWNKWKKN